MGNKINYLLILIGAFVALYANSEKEQNLYVLIIGLALLMIGVYRISKNIPSKFKDDEDNSEEENNK